MGQIKKAYMSVVYDDMALVQTIDGVLPAPQDVKELEMHLRNIIETHSNIRKGKKIKVWSEE